jgi:uncharacterized protein YbjT (DUF2867 family)
MRKVLLAGVTGYLGGYIAKELQKRKIAFRAIARHTSRLQEKGIVPDELLRAELTQPETIQKCCRQIDAVISTVGITRQKDGLSYMDVDFRANLNLLNEARSSGVKKFIYISVLNGEKLRHLKICDAKERFVEALEHSGLDYCVIRPNGFFSDVKEFFSMARKGRVYLFGNGKLHVNPIHGEDLAAVCVDAIDNPDKEIELGGPQTLTHNEIAKTAFDILGTKPKITHLPDWMRRALLNLARTLTGSKTYGPIEFFLTVMAIEMVAPEYGRHTLEEYFAGLKRMDT